ncbi:MAG: DUF2225 domain-containing protein [Clostridiales bacterium]|jgi:uncharacterized protein (DUF2225 family)|nr:DUF2225 domain-containing protein [Clostridiales bacterium]
MESIIAKLDNMGFVNIRILKQAKLKAKTASAAVSDPAVYLYQRNFTCPVCEMDFQNWFPRSSKLRLEDTDLDLRPRYAPFDLTYYDVALCPFCGYGAMVKYFYNITQLKDGMIETHVTPNYIYHDYPSAYTVEIAIERYLVALLNTLVKGSGSSERAYLCLRISWLNRDKNDFAQEALFRQYALSGFKTALAEETAPYCGMDDATIYYLVAELSRREGDTENAALYISKALASGSVNGRLREKILEVKKLIKRDKAKEETLAPFKNIIRGLYGE